MPFGVRRYGSGKRRKCLQLTLAREHKRKRTETAEIALRNCQVSP